MQTTVRLAVSLFFGWFSVAVNALELRAGFPETIPGAVVERGQLKLPGDSGHALPCIQKALGIPVRWTSYPTLRLFKMLEHGELDLLYPMGFSAERDQTAKRSETVTRSRDVWVFKGIRPSLEDKERVTVAAKQGSPQAEYLAKEGYTQVSLTHSYDSLPRMLEIGRVQAIAVPGEGWDRIAPTMAWTASTETYLARDVGFYLPKAADTPWLARLNQAIKSCRE